MALVLFARRPTARFCAACWKGSAGCICGGTEPGVGQQILDHQGPAPARHRAPGRIVRRVARPLAEPGLRGAFFAGRGWSAWTAPPSTCPMPRTWCALRTARGLARRAAPFPSCACWRWPRPAPTRCSPPPSTTIDIGETTLARRLLDHLRPGMLCLADRAFVGFELWAAAAATGADLLWRLRVNQVLPCDKVLPDGSYLSRLASLSPAPPRGEGGVTVRVIDYRLDGRPGRRAAVSPGHHAARSREAPAAEVAALVPRALGGGNALRGRSR